MSAARLAAALTLLLPAAACLAPPRYPEILGSARVVPDFETYDLGRVGLLPFRGPHQGALERTAARQIAAEFMAEAGARLPFEIVPLDETDLSEIPDSDPYRRGWYRPRTILEIAQRYSLDGILVGTVTDRQPFTPQRLSLVIELVAAETGVVVWTGEVSVDASEERARHSLECWFENQGGGGSSGDWSLVLLSPRRIARFAAWEVVGAYEAAAGSR